MFYRHRCFGYSVGLSLSALFTIYLYKTFSKKAVDDVQPVETEPQKTPGEIYLQKWSDQFIDQWAFLHDSIKLGNVIKFPANLFLICFHSVAKFRVGVGTELGSL